jgi:hypothetical protein
MTSFIKTSFAFFCGVYTGQEYSKPGGYIPNIKKSAIKYYKEFIKSDFFVQIKKDLK